MVMQIYSSACCIVDPDQCLDGWMYVNVQFSGEQLYLSYLACINCGSFPVKDCVILITYVFLIQVYACVQHTHTHFPVHHSAHLSPRKLFSFLSHTKVERIQVSRKKCNFHTKSPLPCGSSSCTSYHCDLACVKA